MFKRSIAAVTVDSGDVPSFGLYSKIVVMLQDNVCDKGAVEYYGDGTISNSRGKQAKASAKRWS